MPIQHWSPLLPYISLAFIYLFIYSYSYFFGGLCTYPSNGAPTLSDANKSSKNSIHTRLGITPSHISSRTYMPHGMMEVVLYNFTYLFPLNLGVNNQSAIQCIWSSSTNSWLHAPPGSSSKLKATVEFAPSPLVWQKCGNCSDWAIWRYPICSHPPPSIWVYPVGFYQKGCMAISQFTTTSSSSSSSSSHTSYRLPSTPS